MQKIILSAVFILGLILLIIISAHGQGNEQIGIGVITNKITYSSETFKIYEIFNSLNFKNRSGGKLDIVYSDNASSTEFYITGELQHYKIPAAVKNQYVKSMLVIDDESKATEPYTDGYITKVKLQLWKSQKFQSYFSDSVLYIPTNGDMNTELYRIIKFPGFYDESFELLSPLLLNFFKYLTNNYGINVTGLKNGQIFKFDVKPHVLGSPLDLNQFLSTRRSSIVKGSFSPTSFNEYFENKFTTVSSKELFFIEKYGNNEMESIVSNIAYPKTCWKEAVESYISLGKMFYEEKNYEGFSIANWSAFILANQMKEKISQIFLLKKEALQNLSKYSELANQVNYNKLIKLNIALIDGLLSSGIVDQSHQDYNDLMNQLEKTFSDTQDVMNDLRKQENNNKILNTLSFAVTASSAVNDGLQGLKSSSSTTQTLMNSSLDLQSSLDNGLLDSKNLFQSHFANINFDIPIKFLQPEGDKEIDYNKTILYLECMKLIYADKNNQYWQRCFENFPIDSKEVTEAFFNLKNAQEKTRLDALIELKQALSKYERTSFLTEKLHRYAKDN